MQKVPLAGCQIGTPYAESAGFYTEGGACTANVSRETFIQGDVRLDGGLPFPTPGGAMYELWVDSVPGYLGYFLFARLASFSDALVLTAQTLAQVNAHMTLVKGIAILRGSTLIASVSE